MRDFIIFAAAMVFVGSVIPYVRDTLKDKTHPNIVTWFTWMLLNIINVAAALSVGAWQTAIYGTAGAIATGAIVVAGIKHGVKKYTMFDIVCQVTALLGIPLWVLTGKPELAVLVLLGVDFVAGMPTLRHAWKAPREETWQAFALSAFGGILTLISLNRYDMVALTMPLYIFLFDACLVATILMRRRKFEKMTAQL